MFWDKTMSAYLFVHNPENWQWTNIEDAIRQVETTGVTAEEWTVSSHRQIQPGDRAFLVRVGPVDNKGIFAAGEVSTMPFISEHWDRKGGDAYYVGIKFEKLLNPDEEPILPLATLQSGNLAQQNWTPQSSGISIRPEVIEELEAVWFDFLTTQNIRSNPFEPTANTDQNSFREGTPVQVTLTRYERNPYARKVCLDHYGPTCVICDFNFEKIYGAVGKDIIHVHHLTQIADAGKSRKTDPIRDLRPVCPNCHAMIHRRKEAYSLDEVKTFIESAQ